jgi:hypothetical protein
MFGSVNRKVLSSPLHIRDQWHYCNIDDGCECEYDVDADYDFSIVINAETFAAKNMITLELLACLSGRFTKRKCGKNEAQDDRRRVPRRHTTDASRRAGGGRPLGQVAEFTGAFPTRDKLKLLLPFHSEYRRFLEPPVDSSTLNPICNAMLVKGGVVTRDT